MHEYLAHFAAEAASTAAMTRAETHRRRVASGRDMRAVLAAPLIEAVDGLCHRLAVRRDDALAAVGGAARSPRTA